MWPYSYDRMFSLPSSYCSTNAVCILLNCWDKHHLVRTERRNLLDLPHLIKKKPHTCLPMAAIAAWAVSALTSVQYPLSSSSSIATFSSFTSSTSTCSNNSYWSAALQLLMLSITSTLHVVNQHSYSYFQSLCLSWIFIRSLGQLQNV